MGFGIMRVEKRGRSAVYGLQIEANRTEADHERGRDFDQSDIAWERTHENERLVRTENWNRAITEQIHRDGLREKKDSIVLLDGLYTASPEWFESHTKEEALEYFRDCLDFHVKEYCGDDRTLLLNAVVHFDEKTPHMQVASVPVVEDEKGKHLSAKIIMGSQADYRKRQDRFWDEVCRERGLERGVARDPAETKAHTTKREWQLANQDHELDLARLRTVQEQERTQEAIDRRKAAIEHADEQKLEALRERDAARADRDVVAALASIQHTIFDRDVPVVKVLEEYPEKKAFGKVKEPARVVISKDDLGKLHRVANDARRAEKAAAELTTIYKGMKETARQSNMNRIDLERVVTNDLVQHERERADGLERELSSTRNELAQEKEKNRCLTHELNDERGLANQFRDLLQFFREPVEKLLVLIRQKKLEYAIDHPKLDAFGRNTYKFDGDSVSLKWLLREYKTECEQFNRKMRPDLKDRCDRLLTRDEGREHTLSR